MSAPRDEALAEVLGSARDATGFVPADRRADWEKLVSGFAVEETRARRLARVESLLRACTLFDRQERDTERLAQPLEWDDPVDRVDGLGPAARRKLEVQGIRVAGDLLWTLPVGWDDLRSPLGVAAAIAVSREAEAALSPPPRCCVHGRVQRASLVPMRGRRAVRLSLVDVDGPASLDAWWFYAAHGVLEVARPGAVCLLVGRVRGGPAGRARMVHPEIVRDEESARVLRPRYPGLGVAPGTLRRAMRDVVARSPRLPDPVPADVAARESMPDVEPLLRAVHGTGFGAAPEQARGALAARLGWVEAFVRVWQRVVADARWEGARAPVLACDPESRRRVLAALGFELTEAQRRAVEEVTRDLASPAPMRRLVLGDVGTGKTAVALVAAAQCAAAGFQCALLVPTGLLAEQYVDAAAPVARAVDAGLLRVTAGMRAEERRLALEAMASGRARMVVGTHALLSEEVAFARLGLVVVDEQQRLGVAQRLAMVRKAEEHRPHLLSLSATPIPRTLALALRGELATSVLDERPAGRLPVATELWPRRRMDAIYEEMRQALALEGRVFFVCPRIEEDEEEEQAGAEEWGQRLTQVLGPSRVVVVHGALPVAERTQAMRAFRRGEAQVLVGTTVIEVGLDVPEATLMVIHGAERFGLAQLHQLRGRVGRGARVGRCMLVHDEPLQEGSRRRLEALVRTHDGAEIARADLAMRGAGDLGGTRQSGVAEDFVWLDPTDPPPWIERIDSDARAILLRDPALQAPEHRALSLAVRRHVSSLAVREEAG